jgi:hypothetical protein
VIEGGQLPKVSSIENEGQGPTLDDEDLKINEAVMGDPSEDTEGY